MNTNHTFFNVITLPDGNEAEALEAWKAVGHFMERQKGFLGSTLYRNRRDPNMVINHGIFGSVEDFMACTRAEEFQKLSQTLTDLGVKRIAGLYDTVQSFGAGSS